jgi:DNA polymerase III subunit epsilon
MATVSADGGSSLEAAAALLAASPDYRVVRRLATTDDFHVALNEPTASAVAVDTETTGTSRDADQVIELALTRFEYGETSGAISRITGVYSELEDPGRPIPPASTAIHGITDAMVAGRRIDDARVAELLAGVKLVVAHNAAFDRPFLEERLPVFVPLPWGDSFSQVPWEEEGIRGRKLEYLGWMSGFFYDGHRSEIDCRALLEVLRRPLPKTGRIAFSWVLEAAATPALRLWATGSPFESKDALRERGYRWDADRRCWHRVVAKAAAKEESEWLKAVVYSGRATQIDVEILDATVQFSGRNGPRKARVL